MRTWPGTPYPLGATWDGWGTNFALFSEVAERVDLCLFASEEGGDGSPLTEEQVEVTDVMLDRYREAGTRQRVAA